MPEINLHPRPAVQVFAEDMERKLRKRDDAFPHGWSEDDALHLLTRLHEEVEELEEAIAVGADAATIVEEAADVANFAMMLADNHRGTDNERKV